MVFLKKLLVRPGYWRFLASHGLASWLVILIDLMIWPPTYGAKALQDLARFIGAPVYVPYMIILGLGGILRAFSLPGLISSPLTGVVLFAGTYLVLFFVVRARLKKYSAKLLAGEHEPARALWPIRLLLSLWGPLLLVHTAATYAGAAVFRYYHANHWKYLDLETTDLTLAPLLFAISLLNGVSAVTQNWPFRDFAQYPSIVVMWKCYLACLGVCFVVVFALAMLARMKVRKGKWIKKIGPKPGLAAAEGGARKSTWNKRLQFVAVVILLVVATGRFCSFAAKPEVDIDFAYIPPGEFMMGIALIEKDYYRTGEIPQHRVRISKGFHIGVTEVTQAQWKAVMGTNPSYFKGDDLPVERVSWYDAVQFCERLTRIKGKRCRLPTEAEWEYACRAGSQTRFYFGDDLCNLDEYAWRFHNSNWRTHPVGQKKPNAFRLYDMHGNVKEWCSDWYYDDDYYRKAPLADPAGPDRGMFRVLRGGSWSDGSPGSYFCRCDTHGRTYPDMRINNTGFRVVMEADK